LGAVLHLGKIAEMRTGEGKRLTATMPACHTEEVLLKLVQRER